MANLKKRPNKKAKAAQKILSESKLLAEKLERDLKAGAEFQAPVVSPRTNSKAIKPRPDKKRG